MYSTKRINHRLADSYLSVGCEYQEPLKAESNPRVKGVQFQTLPGGKEFSNFNYQPDKFIDTDSYLKSQPTRVTGFGSGDAHRVSEFTQDFKVKQHRETLKREYKFAFADLDSDKAKWGSETKTRAEGFLYDRASDRAATEPCNKSHRDTHYRPKGGPKRIGKLEHTSSMDIGYLVDDMEWWEKKEHGAKSATAGFDDIGHLKL